MNKTTQNKSPLTPKEFDELIKLFPCNNKNFPDEQPGSTNFLFRCETCTDIGMDIQWYQLVIDTTETVWGKPIIYRSRKNEKDLRKGYDGSNLSKILENDETDYQDSGLNYINKKGYKGYVCDHCMDSIFRDDSFL